MTAFYTHLTGIQGWIGICEKAVLIATLYSLSFECNHFFQLIIKNTDLHSLDQPTSQSMYA